MQWRQKTLKESWLTRKKNNSKIQIL
jgi:hypothetical protein